MSSDSVNMSGAVGFFGLAPENTQKKAKKTKKKTHDGFFFNLQYFRAEYLEHVFDSHTVQRSIHAAGGRDTRALDYKPATE